MLSSLQDVLLIKSLVTLSNLKSYLGCLSLISFEGSGTSSKN